MMSLVRAQLGEPKEYSLSTVGVDDAGGPPVPIPNTEVKPCSAENSSLATGCENRKMPTSIFLHSSVGSGRDIQIPDDTNLVLRILRFVMC